jgi:hypothetical protein
MQFVKTVHKKVKPDGTFKDQLGAVVTAGAIRIGQGQGCGLKGCKCSDGHYIMIALPRTNGKVEVITVRMTEDQMDTLMTIKHVEGEE